MSASPLAFPSQTATSAFKGLSSSESQGTTASLPRETLCPHANALLPPSKATSAGTAASWREISRHWCRRFDCMGGIPPVVCCRVLLLALDLRGAAGGELRITEMILQASDDACMATRHARAELLDLWGAGLLGLVLEVDALGHAYLLVEQGRLAI